MDRALTQCPDYVEDELAKLSVYEPTLAGFATNTLWQHSIKIRPEMIEEFRLKQIAYLGRYGRQDMTGWGEVETPAMSAMYRAIADIVAEENESSGLTGIRENM